VSYGCDASKTVAAANDRPQSKRATWASDKNRRSSRNACIDAPADALLAVVRALAVLVAVSPLAFVAGKQSHFIRRSLAAGRFSRVAVGKLEGAVAVPDAASVASFIRAAVGITASS
jgi:hypothetical protein